MSVGKNIRHDSATSHVKGESVFLDDRPTLQNEVLVGIVGSPVSAGKIIKIDYSNALNIEGILAVYTGQDFHHNLWGTIVSEQPILVTDEIGYIDEPVCLIAGKNQEAIELAKKCIVIEVEQRKPILTIEDAVLANSLICTATSFIRGDVAKALLASPHVLKGDFICGGQEHFYLESQASIAYPLENNQIEIHSSSQHPTETQHVVAHALGLDFSQVVCVVKRMGGGFGGKESQAAHFAAMAALVAHKLHRPARLVLTKDEDMAMTGKRHPFKNSYEVGFDQDGKILAFKTQLIANGGAYTDLTPSILDRAMFHVDGCYYLENCLIEGKAVRTNQHSNTAFRGFGGPQGNMTIESVIEDMANFLKIDSFKIRSRNLYQKEIRNITPYGQLLDNNVLPEIFSKLHQTSDYQKRFEDIKVHNQLMNGKIRGLSMTGCKFGIAFTAKFLNQGNALVNIHVDGTIQISTGATEMGQGVNTKMQQIAAHAFGVHPRNIIIMPTSTEKNHNTSPTAASSATDINGAATLKACEKILERLKWIAHFYFADFKTSDVIEFPDFSKNEALKINWDDLVFANEIITSKQTAKTISWKELVKIAYMNRVSLGDYAFFKTPDLGFDKKTLTGKAFNYFTNGAAVSEVEIDEYTGELKVLRTDILIDLGRSINPGIDLGQVSGAFIQGMGWVTTENLFYKHDTGKLLSHSPTTYKIPNIQDSPRIFNIDLLENNTNEQNVLRSKAVGEPPLLLGSSVWTAVKNALSFRSAHQLPTITSPATAEVILVELVRY
jgi:xanthine dehydrogenase large subunit